MGDTIVIETPVATVLEVSGKQGPQGVPGATGATGAVGPQGPAGTGIEALTTAGDLLYRDNSAAARLPIGSSSQILKVVNGLPAWANESGAVTSVNGQTGAVTVTVPSASSSTPSALGTAAAGSSSDYARADHIHSAEVSDSAFRVLGSTDATKKVALEVDTNVPTGTTVTLTAPDGNGTIARTSDIPSTFAASAITSGVFDNARINFAAPSAIGSTTPSTGAFTTLSASGTVSGTGFSNYLASPPAIGGTSAAAGSFTTLSASTSLTLGASGILSGGTNTIEQRNTTSAQTFRIYNTVSGAADANYERGFMRWSSNVLQIGTEAAGTGSARALEFQTGGTTRMTIANDGNITMGNFASFTLGTNGFVNAPAGVLGMTAALWNNQLRVSGSGVVAWYTAQWNAVSTDLEIARDAADTLAQRRAGNAQTFRIYNTFTSTTNFERLNIRWASNECIIDAQAGGGGGTLRGIKIGSATSSLLGFYGATPVTQRAAIADATDAATTQARLNDLLAAMRSLGLIAT